MSRTFETDAFIHALDSGELENIAPIELPTVFSVTGYVKSGDGSNLQFAPSNLCAVWISIPKTIIKSVEYYGKRQCLSGSFEYARLDLTVPISDDPIVTAFSGIASAMSMETNMALSDNQRLPEAGGFPPPIVNYWDWPTTREWQCAACVVGWTAVVAGAAAFFASTGGIGVVAVSNYIVSTYSVSTATAHAIAAGVVAGTPTALIAKQLCPTCD